MPSRDATFSTCGSQARCVTSREPACHRGPRGTREAISQASFCLLLRAHTPFPGRLCAQEAGLDAPVSGLPLSSGFRLGGAPTGGRREARSECPPAESHHSRQVVLPADIPSTGWAPASSLPFRVRSGSGSRHMLTL